MNSDEFCWINKDLCLPQNGRNKKVKSKT